MAMASRAELMPAIPRQPVTVRRRAAGPAGDSGTPSIITNGMAVACMSQVCARMRPVGDSAHSVEQPSPVGSAARAPAGPPGSSRVGEGCQRDGSGSRSRRSV